MEELSRRKFLKGSAAIGGTTLLAGFAACSPQREEAREDESVAGPVDAAVEQINVVETYDCDILVAGCGSSGIECIAAASMNGAKVIGIEKREYIGGNGQFTEGVFAVNSPRQQEMGITIKKSDLMQAVLGQSQMVADGALWDKFVDMSGENIKWLTDLGVELDDPIDGAGLTAFPCIHLFSGEGLRSASTTLIPILTKIAEDNGVTFMTETPFTSLIADNTGRVTGCYATNADGETVQFNSKVVILATGSFAGDEDLVYQRGFNVAGLDVGSTGVSMYNTGDALKAAVRQCNAKTMVELAAWNSTNVIGGIDPNSMFSVYAVNDPNEVMFINQDGNRFIPEDYAEGNKMLSSVPGVTQKQIYSVFDHASVERWADYPVITHPPQYYGFTPDEVADFNDPALNIGDTLEEVGQKADVDLDLLKTAVDRYNELVAQGEDTDFGKASKYLFPISTPPFYIAKLSIRPGVMIGALYTDMFMRVLDARKNVIEGLYAIGTDGCMLYRTYYSHDYACTSANAHNLFSARVAADHICQNLL
jgi:fumarate reductase flavoprotein subunit